MSSQHLHAWIRQQLRGAASPEAWQTRMDLWSSTRKGIRPDHCRQVIDEMVVDGELDCRLDPSSRREVYRATEKCVQIVSGLFAEAEA